MSSATLWLTASALLFVVLFMVNAVIYRRRFGAFLPKQMKNLFVLRKQLSHTELALAIFLVVSLLIGTSARDLVSDTSFGRWLAEPYALVVYSVWCVLVSTILSIVIELCRYFASKLDQ